MVILLRSEPERKINLHVQDFDPQSDSAMSRRVFIEAERKLSFHVDLSLFHHPSFFFPCIFLGTFYGGV